MQSRASHAAPPAAPTGSNRQTRRHAVKSRRTLPYTTPKGASMHRRAAPLQSRRSPAPDHDNAIETLERWAAHGERPRASSTGGRGHSTTDDS